MRYFLTTICLLIACSVFFAVGTLESHDKQIATLDNQVQVIREEIGSLQLETVKINDNIDILTAKLNGLSQDEADSRSKLQGEIDGLKGQLKSLEDQLTNLDVELNKKMNEQIAALEARLNQQQQELEKQKKNTNKKMNIAYILAVLAIGAAIACD